MRHKTPLLTVLVILVAAMLASACQPGTPTPTGAPEQAATETPEAAEPAATEPEQEPTAAQPAADTDEPVRITGSFEYSNDFVTEVYYVEHAVAINDMTGFILRDKEWELPVDAQTLGYMDLDAENNSATFEIDLPAAPEGILNDVDNNGSEDAGVQIYAVSYSPNLYGGPFSVSDDRSLGWPSYLASVKTDTENQDEVIGGTLLIWAPDADQQFPTGFGDDGLLFTEDDPVGPVPAGYSVVDLDADPFEIVRQPEVDVTLYEPTDVAIKDFSQDSYTEAFDKMFEIVRNEYAFTGIPDKSPDWDTLYDEIQPMVQEAEDTNDPYLYYQALQQFVFAFKDGHFGLGGGQYGDQYFQENTLFGYGLALQQVDDGSVIVTYVTEGGPAAAAGIQAGAVVTEWNGQPVEDAAAEVQALSGPFSTGFSESYQQFRYLTRGQEGDTATVTFQNPNAASRTVELETVQELNSFQATSLFRGYNPNALPVEFAILPEGVGYVKINSNYDDLNLLVRLFERALQTFELNQVPGIIIDMRLNQGGASLGLAGFLHDEEIQLGQLEYFSEATGQFEPEGPRERVFPNENQYRFEKMVLLVNQTCYSACEIEAYGFSQVPGMVVMGQYPSAGVEAEVARGQFQLPEGMSLQVPTGRFTLPDGSIFLEGEGVQPTVDIPITVESVLSGEDVVLQAAVNEIVGE